MPNRLGNLPPVEGWEQHGQRPKARLKEIKRREAEERQREFIGTNANRIRHALFRRGADGAFSPRQWADDSFVIETWKNLIEQY